MINSIADGFVQDISHCIVCKKEIPPRQSFFRRTEKNHCGIAHTAITFRYYSIFATIVSSLFLPAFVNIENNAITFNVDAFEFAFAFLGSLYFCIYGFIQNRKFQNQD